MPPLRPPLPRCPKAPYNINKLSVEVAFDAFRNLPRFREHVALILSERAFLVEGLRALPFVTKIHHSDANFVLFVVPLAQELYKSMADAGVVCRYRGMETHCEGCLRVTVGTREENDKFLALLASTAQRLGAV